MPPEDARLAEGARAMTHAEKLQLLRDLADESRAANERTKATLAWFTGWMAARHDGNKLAEPHEGPATPPGEVHSHQGAQFDGVEEGQ